MISDAILPLLTGSGMLLPAAAFVMVGAAVFAIASRLARHADAVADATGLGRLWIGTILLAASTSLPELTTDVNAALLGKIDIGVGDLLGSTMANMLLFATLDLAYARRRILDHVSVDHILVGTLAVMLTAIAGAAVASGGWGRIGHVGIETPAIFCLYLLGMRAVYANACTSSLPVALEEQYGDGRRAVLWRALLGFAAAAAGLLLAAPLLVLSAEAVAIEGGLTETFVGTMLVGLTTSFPEMAATVAAIRMGALDLAVGNIFGSNVFNMCVLLAMDVAYTPGPLLAHASKDHVLTAQLAVLAISLGMFGILSRRARWPGPVRLESLLIVLTYGGALWLLAAG